MLDAVTFELAYREYGREVNKIARAVTRDSAEAEDIAQEAWIVALTDKTVLRLDSIVGWLRTVIKRLWWQSKHHKETTGDRKYVPLPQEVEFVQDAHDSIEEPAQDIAAEVVVLHKAIDNLTVPWIASNGKPYDRAMSATAKTTMHMYARLGSKAEVARLRDMSETNVTNVVNRAIAALRIKWGLQ